MYFNNLYCILIITLGNHSRLDITLLSDIKYVIGEKKRHSGKEKYLHISLINFVELSFFATKKNTFCRDRLLLIFCCIVLHFVQLFSGETKISIIDNAFANRGNTCINFYAACIYIDNSAPRYNYKTRRDSIRCETIALKQYRFRCRLSGIGKIPQPPSPTISSFGMQDLAGKRARVRRPTNVIRIFDMCARNHWVPRRRLSRRISHNVGRQAFLSQHILDTSRCWLHLSLFLSLTSRDAAPPAKY